MGSCDWSIQVPAKPGSRAASVKVASIASGVALAASTTAQPPSGVSHGVPGSGSGSSSRASYSAAGMASVTANVVPSKVPVRAKLPHFTPDWSSCSGWSAHAQSAIGRPSHCGGSDSATTWHSSGPSPSSSTVTSPPVETSPSAAGTAVGISPLGAPAAGASDCPAGSTARISSSVEQAVKHERGRRRRRAGWSGGGHCDGESAARRA